MPNKQTKLSLFPWLNKQWYTVLLCLHVADPATFLASMFSEPYFPLRKACLFSAGKKNNITTSEFLLLPHDFECFNSPPLKRRSQWFLCTKHPRGRVPESMSDMQRDQFCRSSETMRSRRAHKTRHGPSFFPPCFNSLGVTWWKVLDSRASPTLTHSHSKVHDTARRETQP